MLADLDTYVNFCCFTEDGEAPADRKSRLLGTMVLNGVSHHIDAIEVKEGEDGVQEAVDTRFEDSLEAMSVITGASGPFSTIEYEGRSYVVNVIPHCR